MPQYQAYGLTLTSTLPFPDLPPGKGKAEVHIEVAGIADPTLREPSPILCTSASPTRVCLTWGTVGTVVIVDGRQITVTPAPDAALEAVRLFVLGAGLGVLLEQRGLLVLHASSVVIQDRVVGFIGAKGWGKSTTAAVLNQRGHALVSDELLAVHFDAQNQPLVITAPPQLRLWSDALLNIGGDPSSATQVRPGIEKFRINASICAQGELPLFQLYLLDGGEQLAIESVSRSEAFFQGCSTLIWGTVWNALFTVEPACPHIPAAKSIAKENHRQTAGTPAEPGSTSRYRKVD
jgi:hypothetical protein